MDATKETTLDAFVENRAVFLNSEFPVPLAAAEKDTFLATLAKRCDDSLATLNLSDRETGLKASNACYEAVDFLECAPSEKGKGKKPIQTCVTGAEATAWQKRIERAAIALDSVRASGAQGFVFSVDRLASDEGTRARLVRASFGVFLAARPRELDDHLALSLLSVAQEGSTPEYRGTKLAGYVADYATRPGYESSLRAVFRSYTWLLSLAAVDKATFLRAERAIYRDPGLRLHDKIYIERRLNAWNLLGLVESEK